MKPDLKVLDHKVRAEIFAELRTVAELEPHAEIDQEELRERLDLPDDLDEQQLGDHLSILCDAGLIVAGGNPPVYRVSDAALG
jgi:hypothetical protein